MKAAMWKNLARSALLVAACAAGVASCSDDDDVGTPAPSTPAPDAGTSTPAATTVQVTVRDNVFEPAQVTIAQGSTVRWTMAGAVEHSVTSGVDFNDPARGQIFDQDLESGGATFEFTFNDPGTFNYFCKYHVGMAGSVVVETTGPGPTN